MNDMVEVLEPEFLMLEDRIVEIKIWEANSEGSLILDLRVPINLKPPTSTRTLTISFTCNPSLK